MILYPHVASWLSKQTEALDIIREMDFLKALLVGGWVLDLPSADVLTKALPNAHIKSMYGMTEMFCVALTKGRVGLDTPEKVARCENEGNYNYVIKF
jgi:acyl-CoA synthetase (AMP-forming)/AMP-acid ligase II